MHYNLKILEYPNGDVQIRRYSTPMQTKKPIDFYEEDLLYNPFNYSPTSEVTDFSSIESPRELTEEERENNRFRSANRTKQMVYTYSRCAFWEYFITLTFSGDKVDRYDFDECSKKAREWLKNQRYKYAKDLKYILVPEQHRDGAWHFHGLLADCGDMAFIDSGHRDNTGAVIYNMVKWRYGFTTATAVKDVHKVAKYIGKYVTKTICDLTPGRQRYFVSQNLPQPKVSTMLLSNDAFENLEVIEKICESYGMKIAHVTKTRAENENFTTVQYFELGN